MEQEESLRILGLSKTSSLNDLSTVFRKLVKKYHPDLNRDREEWSTQKMHYLNEAYDAAFRYLSLPEKERISKMPIKEEREATTYYNSARSLQFSKALKASCQYIFSAMEMYYQYGLDRIPLRHEGTRRNRYYSSIRKMKQGFALLKPLENSNMTREEEEELDIFVHFIRYFYKNIHIYCIRPANSTIFEKKAFRHYTQGSLLVDSIIKEIMFKDFIEPYKRGRLAENIKLAEAELNTVIIDFSKAICLRETEIKKELLHSMLALSDLQDLGRISLY